MEFLHKNNDHLNEYFENLEISELISYHNTYCSENNYPDNQIFDNDEEFFEIFFDNKVMSVLSCIQYGDYDLNNTYVKFNGYGNLESFDDNDLDYHIDIDSLVDDAMDNPERYDIELIDYNDLDDEELFDYLQSCDTDNEITKDDKYSSKWTRERLEEIGFDYDLI